MNRIIALFLCLAATPAIGQVRAHTNEWSLDLFIIGSTLYEFERGATARNHGGGGIGLTVTRNLNDYFAVGVDGTLSEFDYRAGVAPGTGNAAPGFQREGKMESAALRFHATWNLLARPITPFLTAGGGVVFLDPNLESNPPSNACWIYPWYGEVCGGTGPKSTLVRFTYGIGAGVRFDLARDLGFVRALVAGEWIHFSEALNPVGSVQFRADFGLRF